MKVYETEYKDYLSRILRRKYPPRTSYDIHASDVNSCLHATAYLRYKPVIAWRYLDALKMYDGIVAEDTYERMLKELHVKYEKPIYRFKIGSEVLPADHILICSPDFYLPEVNKFVEIKRTHWKIGMIERFFETDYGTYMWRLLGYIDKTTGKYEFWNEVKSGDYWLAPLIPKGTSIYGIQLALYFLAHGIKNLKEGDKLKFMEGDLFYLYEDDVVEYRLEYWMYSEDVKHELMRKTSKEIVKEIEEKGEKREIKKKIWTLEKIGAIYTAPSWIREAFHRLLSLAQIWQYWEDVQKNYLFAREVVPGDRKMVIQKFCRHCPLLYEGICEGIIPFKTRKHTDEEKSILLNFILKYKDKVPEDLRDKVVRYYNGEIEGLSTDDVIALIRIQEEIWKGVWEEANSKYILDKRLWDYVDKVKIEEEK